MFKRVRAERMEAINLLLDIVSRKERRIVRYTLTQAPRLCFEHSCRHLI